MSDAKLTSKGQVTIPKAVRETLNLAPGDRVSFYVQADGDVVLRARNKPIERLFGMLHNTKRKPLTIEQMNPGNDPHYSPDVQK